GCTDLFRDREADPGRTVVAAPEPLQDEGAGRYPRARRNGEKLGPLLQALHAPGALPKRSGAETLATARPPGGHHPAPAFGRHARAEAVTTLAHKLARLIGPLHGCTPLGSFEPVIGARIETNPQRLLCARKSAGL